MPPYRSSSAAASAATRKSISAGSPSPRYQAADSPVQARIHCSRRWRSNLAASATTSRRRAKRSGFVADRACWIVKIRVGEDVGVSRTALAQKPLRVDGEPTARAEIEHVAVMQVAMQDDDLARFGEQGARNFGSCGRGGLQQFPAAGHRSRNHSCSDISSGGGGVRAGRAAGCATSHEDARRLRRRRPAGACHIGSEPIPSARSKRRASPSRASTRAAPSPPHHSMIAAPRRSSSSRASLSMAASPSIADGNEPVRPRARWARRRRSRFQRPR